MAASFTAAIEDLEARAGERFDRAVGLLVTPPRPRPTPRHIRIAFQSVRQKDIDRLVRWLVRRCGGPEADAREAAQDAFTKLLERPDVFRARRERWWGLVRTEARFRLLQIREGQRATVLVDGPVEPSAGAAIEADGSALPVSPAACDYTWAEPPPTGADWSRTQILGALQRYARHHGKRPREADCCPLHQLPRPAAIRLEFGSFGAAMREAGMPGHTWAKVPDLQAARQCESFRKRHGRWPHTSDFRRGDEDLPSPRVAKRIFGSTRSGVVGEAVEAILERDGG
ncbi:MAG TPA: hypothetical protein VF125_00790 [Solirubrobacterales bacterium]